MKQIRPAIVSFVLLSLVTGVVYPLLVTGVAQLIFPGQANGSLITRNGKVVGSTLIGQPFDDPKYFWSRLSATGPAPYNGAVSSGSNYGPMSDALTKAVQGRIDALRARTRKRAADPGRSRYRIGKRLDPHISPAAPTTRSARVARVRGVPKRRWRAGGRAHTRSTAGHSRRAGGRGSPAQSGVGRAGAR